MLDVIRNPASVRPKQTKSIDRAVYIEDGGENTPLFVRGEGRGNGEGRRSSSVGVLGEAGGAPGRVELRATTWDAGWPRGASWPAWRRRPVGHAPPHRRRRLKRLGLLKLAAVEVLS